MSTNKEQLNAYYQQLSASDQESLLAFAQFLAQRGGPELALGSSAAVPVETAEAEPAPLPEPKDIPRPDEEKVILAVKRLSQTYFMLDKNKMLGLTSGLVTQHVMHGRDARDVIDELEEVFGGQYRELQENHRE